MPLFLRPAKLEDSPHIGRIGAASFADTVSSVLFPAELRHLSPVGDAFQDEAEWRASRNYRRMNEGMLTYVVVDKADEASEEEEVVGFAQWEPPKGNDEKKKDQEPAKSEVDSDTLPPPLDQAALRQMYEVIEAETLKVLGPEGHSKMWYLMILGVDPKHQRRGIGKMLVKKGIELIEKDGKDAYLIATLNGRKLYESVGFKAVSDRCYLGDVPHYSMIWKRPETEVPN
ncbi:puromycin N-acetyltransferase [Cladorrhinum sp. PSN259]|nr:puromycin N-acetyltransferase [Cladorrhinum sp. PSN259]